MLTERTIVHGADENDIDLSSFQAFKARLGLHVDPPAFKQATDEDMLHAGVLAFCEGAWVPTLFGVMMFGRYPQRFRATRQFWIKCTAYGIDHLADLVISSGESRGTLPEQVDHAIRWFNSLGRRERFQGLLREEVPLVPVRALREALVNAVIHRDYAIHEQAIHLDVHADRVEIISPGTLANRLTVEAVEQGLSAYTRNEAMARAMVALKYTHDRSMGWRRMVRVMQAHNGTAPKLLNESNGRVVRVILEI